VYICVSFWIYLGKISLGIGGVGAVLTALVCVDGPWEVRGSGVCPFTVLGRGMFLISRITAGVELSLPLCLLF
jgi:hypothetical protein